MGCKFTGLILSHPATGGNARDAVRTGGEGRAWFGGHRLGGWGMLWRLGGSNPDRELALEVVPAALLHQFEHVPAPLPPAPYRKVIEVD